MGTITHPTRGKNTHADCLIAGFSTTRISAGQPAPSANSAAQVGIATIQDSVREEPIDLVPHDTAWAHRFEEERVQVEQVLVPWLAGPIEHIGSTAIPGLVAKPVIDIMAGVRDLPSSIGARAALQSLEYMYFPYRTEVMHWFCKPSPARRTHHLHLVPMSSPLWADRLAFRDYLRSSPDSSKEYAVLKTALAAQYRFDREAYTEAKNDFVQSVLSRARNRTEAR